MSGPQGNCMTIDALPHKARRTPRAQEHGALPIGEIDANIFGCPACARPLGSGSSRCPGCGTRLIARVHAGRAIGFMASGLMIGLLAGGGVMAGISALSRPLGALPATTITGTNPDASAVAVAGVAPAASVAAPVQVPAIPSVATSALRQSAFVNDRLALDAARLSAALAVSGPSSSDLVRILRTLASNAAFGERIAPDLARWTQGASLSTGLTDLYVSIGAVAREGLSASLANTPAHVDAAQQMIVLVDGLTELDAQARALALRAQIQLPPVTLPVATVGPPASAPPP